MASTTTFRDVNSLEHFPLSYLDAQGRPLPQYFGTVRYHSWGPQPQAQAPAPVPAPNALEKIPKDAVLGLYAKADSRIANGLHRIREALQRLAYPSGFSRNDGISVERALELRFRQLYKTDYAEEEDPFVWQVYTWTTAEILNRLVYLKLQVDDLFGTPVVKTTGVPKSNAIGDPDYYSGVDRVTPNLLRPINTRDTWTQASVPGEYDPLHNYGIRRLVAEGKGCVGYRYSCCYQSMGSEGCIIGYPEKDRGSIPQLYTWYAGQYPSPVDAEYRGIVFALSEDKGPEYYATLHGKIKTALTDPTLLQRLERGEFSIIANDPVMFRVVQQVISWMNEYNAPLLQYVTEDIPMTPKEMERYLREHVKVRPQPQQKQFEQKRQQVVLDWKNIFLTSTSGTELQYRLESIRTTYPGPYDALVDNLFLLLGYLTDERKTNFIAFVKSLPSDLNKFDVTVFETNAKKFEYEELQFKQRYYLLFKEQVVDETKLRALLSSEPLKGVEDVLQLLLEAKKQKEIIIDADTLEALKVVEEIPKLRSKAQQLQMTGKLYHIRAEVEEFRKLYTAQQIDKDAVNVQWRKILALIKQEGVKKLDTFLAFVQTNKIEQNLLGKFKESDTNTLRGNGLDPFYAYLSDSLKESQYQVIPPSPALDNAINAIRQLQQKKEADERMVLEKKNRIRRLLKELDAVDKLTKLRNFLYYGKALEKFNYLVLKSEANENDGLTAEERNVFNKFASMVYYIDKRYTVSTPPKDINQYAEVPDDDFYSELFIERDDVLITSFSGSVFANINQGKTEIDKNFRRWVFPKDPSKGLQTKALDSLKEVVRRILQGQSEDEIEKWFREEMKLFIS